MDSPQGRYSQIAYLHVKTLAAWFTLTNSRV